VVRAKGDANHPVGQRNCNTCGVQSGPPALACEPLCCNASAPSGCAASSGGAAPRSCPPTLPHRGSVIVPPRTRPMLVAPSLGLPLIDSGQPSAGVGQLFHRRGAGRLSGDYAGGGCRRIQGLNCPCRSTAWAARLQAMGRGRRPAVPRGRSRGPALRIGDRRRSAGPRAVVHALPRCRRGRTRQT